MSIIAELRDLRDKGIPVQFDTLKHAAPSPTVFAHLFCLAFVQEVLSHPYRSAAVVLAVALLGFMVSGSRK